MVLTSSWWHFLERYVYNIPEPPPRQRTKPLEVICVGPPRSATESLQAALLQLGYDHTHHGWDIIFEKPNRAPGWARLVRRKWLGDSNEPNLKQKPGDVTITVNDFDELLGNCTAITDAAGSVFAAELIEAYPDAKVVLNTRKDLEAWMDSMHGSLLAVNHSWTFYILSWFEPSAFWAWNVYERFLWPAMFRCIDARGGFANCTAARGAWVYREHCNMVRGMVPKERLLEWSAEDGWEPLCEFLGKPVPEEPFPHVNTRSAGWKKKEEEIFIELVTPAIKRLGTISVALLAAMIGHGWYYYTHR